MVKKKVVKKNVPGDNSDMANVPEKPDIVAMLRNADEQQICRRLDDLDAESAGLRTLLRAVRARERARCTSGKSRS